MEDYINNPSNSHTQAAMRIFQIGYQDVTEEQWHRVMQERNAVYGRRRRSVPYYEPNKWYMLTQSGEALGAYKLAAWDDSIYEVCGVQYYEETEPEFEE